MFQMQELHPVVEQKRVDFPFVDREFTAFDPVFVHQHDHVFQIVREHIGLIARGYRIEEQMRAIRDDARRIDIFAEQAIKPGSIRWFRHALVTAAQDRNPTPANLQRTREFFDNRSFTRSADGEISDANDEATKRALAKNAFAIQIESELNDSLVDKREPVKNAAQNRRAKSTTPAENNVDSELL